MGNPKRSVVGIIAGVLLALAGIACVVACLTWAHPCTGMVETAKGMQMPMVCHYTGQAGILVGAILAALGVDGMVRGRPAGLAAIAIGVVLIVLPWQGLGIGICSAEGMACTTTAFWLRTFGGCAIVLGVVSLLVKDSKSL